MNHMLQATPTCVLELLESLNAKGDFWLVGGCVRDVLLGREPKDWDIVTTTPEVVAHLPMIGKDFPVFQEAVGGYCIEIAAARTERKVGEGHNGFEVQLTKDLQLDLLRRDLTVNTFAWRPSTGYTSAPGAREHLQDQMLVHVTEAFAEDPLRVFRVARFAAQLGWKVNKGTLEFMKSLKGELATLPKDRVREELSKALRSPNPDVFFDILRDADCLEHWFPEVRNLTGVKHSDLHHPEGDGWDHTMMVLRKARSLGANETEMLCALGHDFGKALTDPEQWPRHIDHERLGLVPIKQFCNRLGHGHQTEHAMALVCQLHMTMHKCFELRDSTLRKIAKSASRSVLGIQGFGLCCQSDHCGRGGHWDDVYPETEFLSQVQEAVRSVVVDPAWNPQRIEQQQIAAIKMMKRVGMTKWSEAISLKGDDARRGLV